MLYTLPMTQAPKHKRETFTGRLVALVIFGLLVAASITLYFAADRFIQQRTATKFESDTHVMTTHMTERIAQYANLLYSGRALLTLNPDITNSQWQDFFENQGELSRNKGVSSIMYLTYARDVSGAQFTDMLNAQAKTNPAITLKTAEGVTEFAAGSLVASSHKLDYLLGGNMMSDPTRRAALNTSIQTQVPQATPPLKLKSNVDGFLLALPHQTSDDRLLGFTVLSFRSQDLVEELMGAGRGASDTQILDITNTKHITPIYTSPGWSAQGFTRSDQLTVGGRIWQVNYNAPVVKYQDDIMRALPLIFLLLSLTASLVIFIMVLMIFRIRISLFEHSR